VSSTLLWSQKQRGGPPQNDLPIYSDVYSTGNKCPSRPTIIGSRAGVGSLFFDYNITSLGDASAPVFRGVTYQYWRQNSNGPETLEATTIEADAASALGINRVIRYGGVGDIPLTLSSGYYKVKLLASYQFASPPSSSSTRLTIKVNKGAGEITRYDQLSPPQFSPNITVDDNFACFDFIACQQIADNLIVNTTANGDFISATVTPQANYQYIWTTLAYVPNVPGSGSTTPMSTLSGNSTKPFCVNAPISLVTINPVNGCQTEKVFSYDGTFHPNVVYVEGLSDRLMCFRNRPDNYERIGVFEGNQVEINRIQTVIRQFGDGSNQQSVQNYQNTINSPLPILQIYHQYPPQNPNTYYGWYRFISTNGCASPMIDTEKSLPFNCQGPAPDDSQDETSVSPNPVSGTLNIKLKTGDKLESIVILNIAGQVVYSEQINEEIVMKNIDMSNLNSGIYFVKLNNNGGLQKVVKVLKN
jgi:Secretion system C-terminal sorting domain